MLIPINAQAWVRPEYVSQIRCAERHVPTSEAGSSMKRLNYVEIALINGSPISDGPWETVPDCEARMDKIASLINKALDMIIEQNNPDTYRGRKRLMWQNGQWQLKPVQEETEATHAD